MSRLRLTLTLGLILLFAPVVYGQQPCHDTVVHITDTICEGDSYRWDGRELTHTGVYYDTLRRDGNTCDSVSILHLEVLGDIDLEFLSIPVCRGETGYHLLTSFRGPSQQWEMAPPDASFTLRAPNYAHINPTQPTTYTVVAGYTSSLRCPDTASIFIAPIQPVSAGLTVTPACLDYDHTRLVLHDASIGNREAPYGGSYGRQWRIGGEIYPSWSTDLTLDLNEPYPDSVRVAIVAYTPTCADSAFRVIPFNKDQIYIPNIFVAGGENNNRFRPIIQNVATYRIYVYSRLGRLLFQTDNPETSWDGSVEGVSQPQGAYNYRIIYSHTYAPAELHTLSGTVTLLR